MMASQSGALKTIYFSGACEVDHIALGYTTQQASGSDVVVVGVVAGLFVGGSVTITTLRKAQVPPASRKASGSASSPAEEKPLQVTGKVVSVTKTPLPAPEGTASETTTASGTAAPATTVDVEDNRVAVNMGQEREDFCVMVLLDIPEGTTVEWTVLVVGAIFSMGKPMPRQEENSIGGGWVYSWVSTIWSVNKHFAIQEWGHFFNHPVRIVTTNPILPDIVLPLLEFPNRVVALEALGWLSELDAFPMYNQANAYHFLLTGRSHIFGQPISLVPSTPTGVPLVIHDCITYLLKNALCAEGVFRVSGSTMEINSLRDSYNEGRKVDFEDTDPFSVASLLKKFFYELPDPLLPTTLCEDMARASNIETCVELLNSLPNPHKACFVELLELVEQILQNAKQNKMDSSALAVCLAPAIAPERPAPTTDFTHMPNIILGLRYVFENVRTISSSITFN
ncbi:Rho GTPase-activating protein RGD1 [Pelomyxa schiedti]|nr:Rho GTPase-activating protein RGD1 [Pelomyxa schiedti]